MIIDLMNKGIISKKALLMDTYKKAGLSENDVMIILMIMHLSESAGTFVTPTTLSESMNLTSKQIDLAIAKMSEKNYLKFVSKKIDFAPLFIRLVGILEEEYLLNEHKDLFKIVNSKLIIKLVDLQKNELLAMINGSITKQQLLSVVNNNEFSTYQELIKLITKIISVKPKSTSRFNWLEN